MKSKLSFIFIAICFLSCKDNLNDKSKRNENWAWWVDAKTGKASWIPVNKGNPVKNGKFIRFYFNGNKFSSGKLVDGVDVDTTFYYDKNGKLIKYEVPKSDSLEYFINNGPIKMFYPNGKLKAFGVIENHKYGAKWRDYYQNGNIEFIKDLTGDTGWGTAYYQNGIVKDSAYWEAGYSTSIKHWYENGQLKSVYTCRDTTYNGPAKIYWDNGNLEATANYVKGKIVGEEKFWYEDGRIHVIMHKSNGSLNGRQVSYYENGHIEFEYNSKDGSLDGEIKKYDEKGSLVDDRIYKDGVLIEDKIAGIKY